MISEDIFKRRRNHDNTPKYVLLIITNYVVCCVLFMFTTKPNWFFLLTLVLLAVYNYFNIRRNIEEYTKPAVISYITSLAGIILLYFVARSAG
ncbi:hypothetical protein FO440_10810 [Mucilaginibacter corticis]|uniref:Uncharacterized protein n=1 Tax=Mucilaginibacter corticis TaxID=2597670 RepID=A0A556MK17_9SPHI|nr:hypothetical protein [Mucilaginibacter corticis]TSJ40247.1 hypothetical protein FO440_10810 [Mucilaginibacter corticis]